MWCFCWSIFLCCFFCLVCLVVVNFWLVDFLFGFMFFVFGFIICCCRFWIIFMWLFIFLFDMFVKIGLRFLYCLIRLFIWGDWILVLLVICNFCEGLISLGFCCLVGVIELMILINCLILLFVLLFFIRVDKLFLIGRSLSIFCIKFGWVNLIIWLWKFLSVNLFLSIFCLRFFCFFFEISFWVLLVSWIMLFKFKIWFVIFLGWNIFSELNCLLVLMNLIGMFVICLMESNVLFCVLLLSFVMIMLLSLSVLLKVDVLFIVFWLVMLLMMR